MWLFAPIWQQSSRHMQSEFCNNCRSLHLLSALLRIMIATWGCSCNHSVTTLKFVANFLILIIISYITRVLHYKFQFSLEIELFWEALTNNMLLKAVTKHLAISKFLLVSYSLTIYLLLNFCSYSTECKLCNEILKKILDLFWSHC